VQKRDAKAKYNVLDTAAQVTSMMKLSYTILCVADVASSLRFYERAFGFKKRFLHESGTYGGLDTGETTLSFAAHNLAQGNFKGGYVRADESKAHLGMKIGLVTGDVRRLTPTHLTPLQWSCHRQSPSPEAKLCRMSALRTVAWSSYAPQWANEGDAQFVVQTDLLSTGRLPTTVGGVIGDVCSTSATCECRRRKARANGQL
jgi:hypothetical protein